MYLCLSMFVCYVSYDDAILFLFPKGIFVFLVCNLQQTFIFLPFVIWYTMDIWLDDDDFCTFLYAFLVDDVYS